MGILYVVGFYVLLVFLGLIFKKIGELLETRRYRIKLRKLAPQLDFINIDEWYIFIIFTLFSKLFPYLIFELFRVKFD